MQKRLCNTRYAQAVYVLITVLAVWAVMFPALADAQQRKKTCMDNLKTIAMGMSMYLQDYDGFLPPARDWNYTISPYLRYQDSITCPDAGCGIATYAMNRALQNKDVNRVKKPTEVVLLYDSFSGKDMYGGPELACPRHNGGCYVAFLDGHVKWVAEADMKRLVWIPELAKPRGK